MRSSTKRKLLAKELLSRVRELIQPVTNPETMKKLMKELKLDGFVTSDTNFNSFIKKIRSEPIDLKPLLDKTEQGILENIGMCSMLAAIQKNNWISDDELQASIETFQVQAHLLLFFEAFTVLLANNNLLSKDLLKHLMQQKKNVPFAGHPLSTFLFGAPNHATTFEMLKIISVTVAVTPIIYHNSKEGKNESVDDIKKFTDEYGLYSIYASSIGVGEPGMKTTGTRCCLTANMAEAVRYDKNFDNSVAGLALMGILLHKEDWQAHYEMTDTVLPEHTQLNGTHYSIIPDLEVNPQPKLVSQLNISKEWRDLYNSWDLCFLLGNLDGILLLLIKLIEPSVLSANLENYKMTRTLSLYLFANIYLDADVSRNPYFSSLKFKFENADLMLAKFGKINKMVAANMLKENFKDETLDLDNIYNEVFGKYPTLNLAKILASAVYYEDAATIIPSSLWHKKKVGNHQNSHNATDERAQDSKPRYC